MSKLQYITNGQGVRTAVVMAIKEYEALIERMEDMEDTLRAMDYQTRKAAGQLTAEELETMPIEQAWAEIDAERGNI